MTNYPKRRMNLRRVRSRGKKASRITLVQKFANSAFMQWMYVVEPIGLLVALIAFGASAFFNIVAFRMAYDGSEFRAQQNLREAYRILNAERLEDPRIVKDALELIFANEETIPRLYFDCSSAGVVDTACAGKFDLSGVELTSETLWDGARFEKAFISNVNLSNAKLRHSNFSIARIENSSFFAADLFGSRWIRVTSKDVNFSLAGFEEGDFAMATIEGMKVDLTDFTNADFAHGAFSGIHWGETFDPVLTNAHFSGAYFEFAVGIDPQPFEAGWAWHDNLPTFSGLENPPAILVCKVEYRNVRRPTGKWRTNLETVGPPERCVDENLRLSAELKSHQGTAQ